MKTKHVLTVLALGVCSLAARSQSYLPLKNSFSFGGGIATGLTQSKGDYLYANGNPVCYHLEADLSHYYTPQIALGMAYEHVGSRKHEDKMACHYIAPTLTWRNLFANGKQSFGCRGGIGYLHYSDKLHKSRYESSTFSQGYFAVSFGLVYAFAIAPGMGMQIKAECLMADWHFNPDYTPKWNRYDPDEYQTYFNNNLSYLSLGVSFIIGK